MSIICMTVGGAGHCSCYMSRTYKDTREDQECISTSILHASWQH